MEIHSWQVFRSGTDHARIVIIDNDPNSNTYGRKYFIEGNPENSTSGEFVIGIGFGDIVIDHAYLKSSQKSSDGDKWKTIVNDDTPFSTAVGRFVKAKNKLESGPGVGYAPGGPNSNTVAKTLLRMVGLPTEFYRNATDPVLHGWEHDPWKNHGPMFRW